MKKLFIGALALTMFTACSQDEIVEQQLQPSGSIAFSGAFVDNVTRAATDPSTTTDNIEAFNVWAHIGEAGGVVFDAQEVKKDNGKWTYAPVQYWIPGNTYYFTALSLAKNGNYEVVKETEDAKAKKGLGVVKFTNNDGTYDLIYAKQLAVSAPAAGTEKKVNLTFEHLLSKVKFSFKNGFASDNHSIEVTNVKMYAPSKAEIDLAVDDYSKGWTNLSDIKELSFGHANVDNANVEKANPLLVNTDAAECAYERLTIPSKGVTYRVTFDVKLFIGDVEAYSEALETTITGVELEMGKAYNFIATLNHTNIAGTKLEPIEFDVIKVDGWDEPTINKDFSQQTKVIGVKNAEELIYVLANPTSRSASTVAELNIKLLNNIDLSTVNKPLQIENLKANIDLNGKKLSAGIFTESNGTIATGTTDSYVFWVKNGGELTLTGNGIVETKTAKYSMAVWANDGVVNIYGGEYTNASHGDLIYAKGDNTEVNIYGGTFKPAQKQANDEGTRDEYPALNIHGTSVGKAVINVYGGTFENFNPAANYADTSDPNPITNYVAEGYISKLTSTENNIKVYTVLPEATLQKVKTQEALQNALNAGGTNIVLDANIVTTSTLFVNEKVSAVLNLNGHNIINNSNSTVLEEGDGIIVYGKLEINGQGTVQGNTRAVWARSTTGAEVTINGGNYIGAVGGACEVIYASGNGKITINGGTFEAKTEDKTSFAKPQFAVLNLHANGNDGASISVKGGKFKNFDPANNVSENPVTKGNFVAKDYKSYAVDANWFAVVKE